MKYIKHFLGWLFRYCPYGKGCPPEHPFRLKDKHDEDTKYYGSDHGQGGGGAGGAGGNLTSGGGC